MQSFELPEPPKIIQQPPVDRRAYSIIPIRAVRDRRLKFTSLKLLVAVSSYANRAGLCWPGFDNLAKDLGVTRQTISRQMKRLVAWGYITKVKNHSWGRTAQIMRVIYDEKLSTNELLQVIAFEDKPPGHQQRILQKSIEASNVKSEEGNKVTIDREGLTRGNSVEEKLRVVECVRLWKSACQSANISRTVTPEDIASLERIAEAGVSFGAFEAEVCRVFDDWRQFRREPPHRLSYFARLAV
jgi:DNA-binding MarR family transcriptional regulator